MCADPAGTRAEGGSVGAGIAEETDAATAEASDSSLAASGGATTLSGATGPDSGAGCDR